MGVHTPLLHASQLRLAWLLCLAAHPTAPGLVPHVVAGFICNALYCASAYVTPFAGILGSLSLQVVFNTVYGRVHLDAAGLGGFVFDKELQHTIADAFEALDRTAPQRPLTAAALVDMLRDQRVALNASTLLEMLSVVVFTASRTGVKPTDDISRYTQQWLGGHLTPAGMQLLAETPIGGQGMLHLRALYEGLEGHLALVAEEDLDQRYCVKLPGVLQRRLIALLHRPSASEPVSGTMPATVQAAGATDDAQEGLPLVPLFGAVRSFAYRYLRSTLVRPEDPLAVYLENVYAWPVGAFQVRRRRPHATAHAPNTACAIEHKYEIASEGSQHCRACNCLLDCLLDPSWGLFCIVFRS